MVGTCVLFQFEFDETLWCLITVPKVTMGRYGISNRRSGLEGSQVPRCTGPEGSLSIYWTEGVKYFTSNYTSIIKLNCLHTYEYRNNVFSMTYLETAPLTERNFSGCQITADLENFFFDVSPQKLIVNGLRAHRKISLEEGSKEHSKGRVALNCSGYGAVWRIRNQVCATYLKLKISKI